MEILNFNILSNEKNSDIGRKIIFEMCKIRYGGYEKAIQEIDKLSKNGVLDEQGYEELMKQIIMDKFLYVFNIEDSSNKFKGIVWMARLVIGAKERLIKIYPELDNDQRILIEKYINAIQNLDNNIKFIFPGYTQKTLHRLGLKKLKYSKNDISEDIGINKRTLNKWLKHYYNTKYDNIRKVTFKTYFNIISKFTLKEDESLSFIKDNSDIYLNRLDSDLINNREDLIKTEGLDDLNYKSLKENLKLQGLDSDMKKIPFSLKESFIKKIM